MSEYLLVISNFPDRATAEKAAHLLIEKKLAACVNILAECTSIYRWQGNTETSQEVPLLIKTTRQNYAELETFLQQSHPYQVPEIIALPIDSGLPVYLNWLAESCDTATPASKSPLNR
jgi:periplasmic divalent cation tolerance protein